MRCLEPTNACAATISSLRRIPAPPKTPLCALALAAQGGDARAADALAARLVAALRPLVTRHSRGLCAADVDDLVQDVVVAAFETDLARFDPSKGSFLSFVAKRMRWRVADVLRTSGKRRVDALDDVVAACEPADPLASPEARARAAAKERALLALPRLVDDALAAMRDPAARKALVRHDLDGVALVDVARELGVHASNACRARKRALAHLATALPQELRAAA